MHGFSANFQDICLPQEDLEMIRVFEGIQQQLLTWQHIWDVWVLKFMGVPQPKSMHGFSGCVFPNRI